MEPLTKSEWANLDLLLRRMPLEDCAKLGEAVRSELSHRAGKSITLAIDGRVVANRPRGGAVLYDRPAIGGDRNTDEWYPTLEAANAALTQMAGDLPMGKRADGGLTLDYTHPGCNESEAWVARVSQ